MLCERGFSAHGTLEDGYHETNRIGRMKIKLTDLILRRRTDLGFTRDRHIKYASRLRPSVQCCQVPRRGGSGPPPEGPPVGGTRKTTSMLSLSISTLCMTVWMISRMPSQSTRSRP